MPSDEKNIVTRTTVSKLLIAVSATRNVWTELGSVPVNNVSIVSEKVTLAVAGTVYFRVVLVNGILVLAGTAMTFGVGGVNWENRETIATNSIGGTSTLFMVYSTGMVVVPGLVSELAASLRPRLNLIARKNTASRLLRV